MICAKCGNEIPHKRAEFILKNNKPKRFAECSSEVKVVGHQVIDAKDTRSIQIVTKEQAERLEKAYRQGVGKK